MASKAKQIVISPLAANDLDELYLYLLSEFGQSALEKFHLKWVDFLSVVAFHPRIFPLLHKRKNLRKHAIHPKTLIIYKSSKSTVEIVTLFNNLQNPEKIKKLIKAV